MGACCAGREAPAQIDRGKTLNAFEEVVALVRASAPKGLRQSQCCDTPRLTRSSHHSALAAMMFAIYAQMIGINSSLDDPTYIREIQI
jgi:hypothetical protein